MALIFNSITQFEIQPERTKRRVKRDDLDTLSEVWVGPTIFEDSFVPPIGTAHPEANLMTVINTSTKRLPAGVSEITINYQGKLDSGGADHYTSVPDKSMYWAEGEVTIQSANTSISRRYTGRCVTISYITNLLPSGNPSNIGAAKEFLGFTNVWDVVSYQPSTVTSALPILKMACTDVKIDSKADGWYRVTETYQSRMFPGATSAPTPPAPMQGPITVKTTVGGAGGLEDQNWAAQENAAIASYAAAQSAVQFYSDTTGVTHVLNNSPAGSDGAQTRVLTGQDPAWGQQQDTIEANVAAAAMTAANQAATAPQTSSGSQPLDM